MRFLESEVRDLKELLDEKDEKIDMLSRFHSFSPPVRRPSQPLSPVGQVEQSPSAVSDKEDSFDVQQTASLLEGDSEEPCFVGAASGRAFIGKLYLTSWRNLSLICYRCIQVQASGKW